MFLNNKQKLLADIDTEAGIKLFNGIFDGSTKFPDEFSKNITVTYNLLRTNNPQFISQGFGAAKVAIEEFPCDASATNLRLLARIPALREQTLRLCRQIDERFTENQEKYKKQNGFRGQVITEMTALQILSQFDPEYNSNENKEKLNALMNDPLLDSEEVRW